MTITEWLAIINLICAVMVLVGRAIFDHKNEWWALPSAIWSLLYILK